MNISIIGAGNLGTALGTGLSRNGHNVVYGVRDPGSDKSAKAAGDLGIPPFFTIPDAIVQSNVIVIATPPNAVHELIPQLAGVENKVIIDTTNGFRMRPEGYPTVYHALKALTNCRNIAKCFNTKGFENIADPFYPSESEEAGDVRLDMYMAGDSKYAKEICEGLAKDLGFANCYDFGESDKVELL